MNNLKYKPVLQVANVNAWYEHKQVLSDISFESNRGELICIIGPNGCGKSTLLALIAAIDKNNLRSNGKIFVDNSEISKMKRQDISIKISLMAQSEQSVWDFLVSDFVLAGRYAHTSWSSWYSKEDKDRVNKALSELNICHLRKRAIHSLSGGEIQRVKIARSLVQDSPVMLLDEPIANLDIGCQHTILQQLKVIAKKNEACVLISIHDLNIAAAFADRIILIKPYNCLKQDESQLIIGIPQEIFDLPELNDIYQTNFQIFNHPVLGFPQLCIID